MCWIQMSSLNLHNLNFVAKRSLVCDCKTGSQCPGYEVNHLQALASIPDRHSSCHVLWSGKTLHSVIKHVWGGFWVCLLELLLYPNPNLCCTTVGKWWQGMRHWKPCLSVCLPFLCGSCFFEDWSPLQCRLFPLLPDWPRLAVPLSHDLE